jgi:hypothetical protein
MPFRGHDAEQPEHLHDPVARFFEYEAALEAGRGLLGDRTSLRLAAVGLVLTPGDPVQVVAKLRAIEAQLQQRLTWTSGIPSQLHVMFAAVLLRHDDDPNALLDEVERVRKVMRELNMRRAPVYEFISTLAMRTLGGGARISDTQVERMRDIYEAMKGHHWVLTGPEDFPACAMLTARAGTPQQLAQRAHDIYEALRASGYGRGDPLQTASNMLAMLAIADLPAADVSARYHTLVQAFKRAGLSISADEYDEVAILCFLARPIQAIVDTVAEYTTQLLGHIKWYEGGVAFGFAANLAFARLVGDDPELGPIVDVKALLDMYTILLQAGSA